MSTRMTCRSSRSFFAPKDDPSGSRACISTALANELGFKASVLKDLTWWHGGECLDERSVPGMEIRGDLASNGLYLNIPQAFLEYSDDNWEPPSRWDEGLPGLLFDYNVNARSQHQQRDGSRGYNLSGNGTTGANLGRGVCGQTGRPTLTTRPDRGNRPTSNWTGADITPTGRYRRCVRS